MLHRKHNRRRGLRFLPFAAAAVILVVKFAPDHAPSGPAIVKRATPVSESAGAFLQLSSPHHEPQHQVRTTVGTVDPTEEPTRIHGRVVDARTGDPIERFRITLTEPDKSNNTSSISVRQPQGRFDIAVKHAGPWTVTVAGMLHEDVVAHAVSATGPELELRAQRATCLQGELRDSDGQALEGVAVFLQVLHSEAGYTPSLACATRSGATGWWAFPKLAPGRYSVSVRARSKELLRTPSIELGVHEQLRHDLMLEALPEVRVSVRSEGHPLSGATVSLRAPGDGRYPSINEVSNAKGIALTRFLATGTYELEVRAASHRKAIRTVIAAGGRQDVVVDLMAEPEAQKHRGGG
jgi:hypothetical protein